MFECVDPVLDLLPDTGTGRLPLTSLVPESGDESGGTAGDSMSVEWIWWVSSGEKDGDDGIGDAVVCKGSG